MKRIIFFVMKVFYANENYQKSGVPSLNYFMALMGAAFYIMITGFMLLTVAMTAIPGFYSFYLRYSIKVSSTLAAIITLSLILLILRLSIPEEKLKENSLTREKVTKWINYFLAYGFVLVVIIGFLGVKFLRYYKK